MNDELRNAVATGARTDEIRNLARKNGMQTLKEYATFLLTQGLTSVDEVLANLVVENE
jgi:type IV pilus assembly protein PilB